MKKKGRIEKLDLGWDKLTGSGTQIGMLEDKVNEIIEVLNTLNELYKSNKDLWQLKPKKKGG